jgi:hypothetical protein
VLQPGEQLRLAVEAFDVDDAGKLGREELEDDLAVERGLSSAA